MNRNINIMIIIRLKNKTEMLDNSHVGWESFLLRKNNDDNTIKMIIMIIIISEMYAKTTRLCQRDRQTETAKALELRDDFRNRARFHWI